MKQTKRLILTTVLVFLLTGLAPRLALSDVTAEERDLAYLTDVAVLRPVGLVATVAGFALFLVTLPISIPTLSIEKSFDILVVNPASYTFVRELGGEDVNYDKREEYARQQKKADEK